MRSDRAAHTMGMMAHAATMSPAERAERATENGAGHDVIRDAAIWEVATDMGVSVSELMAELASERAMFENVGRSAGKALEVGQHSERSAAQHAATRATTRATLASDAATMGRAILASYGHRTDVVVTVVNGKASLNRALATGTAATAARRAELAHEAMERATAALATAHAAEHAARAGKLASAILSAESRTDTVAGKLAKLTVKFELARTQHATAVLWEDVPECRTEIVVPAEPEFFQTHAAPVDRVPVRYVEQLRVHPTHGVSDPTGELAMRAISDELAARDRAERKLAARVSADAVTNASSAERAATNAAYKARRATAARERRARQHAAR